MAEYIQLGNIRIEVEYKRIKNLRLTVYPPDGRVRIAAPLTANAEMVRSFAASKHVWIEKQRKRFQSRSGTELNNLDHGVTCHVWGIPLKLEIVERRGHPKIETTQDRLIMYIRPDTVKAKKQELIDKFYRRLTAEAAERLVAKWESLIGVTVQGLYFRKMKAHWGSCNYGKHTIRLNTELAKKSPEYLEYVIVHEMIHIIEPSHNARFYRLMNTYMPSWKIIRKKMNGKI
ncbi:M48 family metallopeptidase [Treponema sp. OttesenSCG-928-L16]|nr:M48 family metallopeptidase [Treponema sp. OttesenSCG-928-L16]